MTVFRNRSHAGKLLAHELQKYRGTDAVVYALPRGGVVTGYEVAHALGITLELVITRKIGHPGDPEYAVCAVGENGSLVCNEDERSRIENSWFEMEKQRQLDELSRRQKAYQKGRARQSAKGKVAIVVDDGVATGLSIRSAVQVIREDGPSKIVVAAPVCSGEAASALREEADEVVVLADVNDFMGSVGAHYEEFPQVSDSEVIHLLERMH